MKANQDARDKHNDQAEVGIGTMIVFIAAVIVAAIAAAVLVNTAGNLQRKSQETGEETTQEVSGNIFVRDTLGHVATVTGESRIDDLNVTIALAPGAEPIDLTTMTVRWKDNETLDDLEYDEDGDGNAGNADGTPGTVEADCDAFADGFCVIAIKEADGGSDDTVLEPGDRVHIHIGMDDSDASEPLETRSEVEILFIPETGSPTQTGFDTPASYSDETFVVL